MDISGLEQISDVAWRVPRTGRMRVPGIVYADEALLRDMDVVREEREKICARIAHLGQVLGEPALDVEAIKRRHLGGDVQRTLYDGHVLADLALVIKELERFRRSSASP